MNSVQEIETAIQKLKSREIYEIANRLQALRDELWDQQIEDDAQTGRLDKMIAKAKAGYRAGKAKALP